MGRGRDAVERLGAADRRVLAERLAQRILDAVGEIPAGHVATYGQVAARAGLPRRARWVGRILRVHAGAGAVPWHRVITAMGRIAPRGSGALEQRRRLSAEGIQFDDRGRIDLSIYGWLPATG